MDNSVHEEEIQSVCLNCGAPVEEDVPFCERCRGKIKRSNNIRVYEEDTEVSEITIVEPGRGSPLIIRRLPFIMASLVLVAILGLVTSKAFSPLLTYNKAAEMFNERDYAAAAETFLSLGNYKDSQTRVIAAIDKISESGNYRGAYDLFGLVPGTDTKRSEVIDLWVDSLVTEAEYAEAYELVDELAPSDAAQRQKSVVVTAVDTLSESGNFQMAYDLLDKLQIADSKLRRSRLADTWIDSLMQNADYQGAYDLIGELEIVNMVSRQKAVIAESAAAQCVAIYYPLLNDPKAFDLLDVWFSTNGSADGYGWIDSVVLRVSDKSENGERTSHYCIFTMNEDKTEFKFVWSVSDSFTEETGQETEETAEAEEYDALQTLLKDAARFNVISIMDISPAPPENKMVNVSRIQLIANNGLLTNVTRVEP
ncbi:MAG: hypothetical protein LBN43_07835 [Oscillospiraceae bacterium]|jgi:hypothetical protein|nr:hypothetical protein [Oscillospiraceae bacterium]